MHRIDTTTATTDNKFTDGVPELGLEATDLNASWFNSVQEEICLLLESLGVELDIHNDGLLAEACSSFFKGFFDNLKANTITIENDPYKVVLDKMGVKVGQLDESGKYFSVVLGSKTVNFYKGGSEPGTGVSSSGLAENTLRLATSNKTGCIWFVDYNEELEDGNGNSGFIFNRDVSIARGSGDHKERVNINLGEESASISIIKGYGQGAVSLQMDSEHIRGLRATLNVKDGNFSGNLDVGGKFGNVGGAEFQGNVDFFDKARFRQPNGNFIEVAATDGNNIQVDKGLQTLGNLTVGGLGNIGNGTSAIIPKKYDAGDSSFVNVFLKNGDLCFVHRNAIAGTSTPLVVTDASSGNSVSISVSSGRELCAIVYRFGSRIFYQNLTY